LGMSPGDTFTAIGSWPRPGFGVDEYRLGGRG
jgi:hypothetical protein